MLLREPRRVDNVRRKRQLQAGTVKKPGDSHAGRADEDYTLLQA